MNITAYANRIGIVDHILLYADVIQSWLIDQILVRYGTTKTGSHVIDQKIGNVASRWLDRYESYKRWHPQS